MRLEVLKDFAIEGNSKLFILSFGIFPLPQGRIQRGKLRQPSRLRHDGATSQQRNEFLEETAKLPFRSLKRNILRLLCSVQRVS